MQAAIFAISNAEESSILQRAIMSMNEVGSLWRSPPNSIIAGNYKVHTMTDWSNSNGGKKEFVIDLLDTY